MLGLYIHIPFCIKKCNYCNFVSVPAKENAQQVDAYIDALVKEIELTGNMYEKTVDSIFIGGGTPSLLDVKQLNKIMTALQKYYKIFGNCEITLESNPCSLDIKKLKAYREMGINRLSIGLQAAQDEHLAALGRQHTVQGFDTAFSNARKAGFKNINVDMIYALPNQTMKELAQTVQHILSKKPEHISAYALKIEKGTPFYRLLQDEKIVQVDEDTDVEMYHKVQEMLCECGYTNY
ncbi:MAG: radical SAM family heme chaperone HemW, partial [Christensenellaceae bacterium]